MAFCRKQLALQRSRWGRSSVALAQLVRSGKDRLAGRLFPPNGAVPGGSAARVSAPGPVVPGDRPSASRRLPAAVRITVLLTALALAGGIVAAAGPGLRTPADAKAEQPVAPRHSSRVLTYLRTISGTATVAGQHNREPLSQPTLWTDRVRSITDENPGLYGSDFAFTAVVNRPVMVAAAIAQWRAGGLVTLMWHMCPPGMGQTCDWKRDVQSRLTDAQWAELTTDGAPLNLAWKSQIDALVPFLLEMKAAGVEVLWRPVHELNEAWAWWGGRPGPGGSSKLYRIMHDYLSGKGLTNLIWVWSVKDLDIDRVADYYPGDAYVDVVGLDSWMQPFPAERTYQRLLAVAGSRPLALTEVGTVPTPAQLAEQPRWSYFMVWAEMLVERSSVARIQYTYADKRVVTRGRITLPPSAA